MAKIISAVVVAYEGACKTLAVFWVEYEIGDGLVIVREGWNRCILGTNFQDVMLVEATMLRRVAG